MGNPSAKSILVIRGGVMNPVFHERSGNKYPLTKHHHVNLKRNRCAGSENKTILGLFLYFFLLLHRQTGKPS
jgi:hypothetical protein